MLHSGSHMALGFIGFLILFTLFEEKKISAKPITIAIFSFCFALAIGAIWEIFEFAMALIIGVVAATLSSTFIASSFVYWWEEIKDSFSTKKSISR